MHLLPGTLPVLLVDDGTPISTNQHTCCIYCQDCQSCPPVECWNPSGATWVAAAARRAGPPKESLEVEFEWVSWASCCCRSWITSKQFSIKIYNQSLKNCRFIFFQKCMDCRLEIDKKGAGILFRRKFDAHLVFISSWHTFHDQFINSCHLTNSGKRKKCLLVHLKCTSFLSFNRPRYNLGRRI